jgi:hypothetical protein
MKGILDLIKMFGWCNEQKIIFNGIETTINL